MSAPPAALHARARGRVWHAALTWVSGVGARVIVSLAGFFATPLLVVWLGDARWGAWTVVLEWLGYLGLGQLALGPGAMTIFLLRAHTSGDATALTAVAKRGLRLYLWAAAAMAPAALALAWWAPLGLGATGSLAPELRWAVAIAAVGSLLITPPLLFRSVLEAVQRGYLVHAALLAQSLLITGLSLLWVWWRWGLVGMALANLAGMVVGAALWCWWARAWLPQWAATAAARISGSEIWRYNWPLVAALAGYQLNQLTDNTVVGMSLGPAAVAGFALTQSLPLLAGSQMANVGVASWAALGELRVRDPAAFADRVVELAATVLGVAIALLATVGVFTPAFVTLWVGGAHYDGSLLTWATVAGMAVFSVLVLFSWLYDSQGDARRRLWISSLGALLNLGLSLALVRVWGVAGVAIATLIAYLVTDAWFLPYLAVRHYGVPGGDLVRALAGALLRGGVWAAAIVAAGWRLPRAGSWALLVAETAVAGAAALVYCWFLVLRPGDRAAWWGRWQAWRQGATP